MKAIPGDVVRSEAGRDKGGCFIVVAAEGEYALLCDGRRRKVQSPKRKKLKHLSPGAGHCAELGRRLAEGGTVTNREIKRGLAAISFEREC